MKNFLINDEHYYIQNNNVHLLDLILYFNYNESLLVLELNQLICNKSKWQNIYINDQDTIEVITIVGGG